MSERRYVEFESIHSGIQSDVGRFRLAPNGIGWKSTGNKTTVIAADDVKKVSWSRAARGHQVRIVVKDNTVYKFDGFRSEVGSIVLASAVDLTPTRTLCVGLWRFEGRHQVILQGATGGKGIERTWLELGKHQLSR